MSETTNTYPGNPEFAAAGLFGSAGVICLVAAFLKTISPEPRAEYHAIPDSIKNNIRDVLVEQTQPFEEQLRPSKKTVIKNMHITPVKPSPKKCETDYYSSWGALQKYVLNPC